MVPGDLDGDPEIVEAVRAVRAGNVQAYARIVERFGGPILTVCAAILRDRGAAEELAQDVFVRAYERLNTFDVRKPMKPWLVKIAFRLALEHWRAQVRETARRRAFATMLRASHDDPPPPERLSVREQAEVLWQAVFALPLAQRTAVVLYYRENLTVKEVAKAMGVSPGTVKTHLLRARAAILINLRAKGFEKGEIP